jgi:hypothetical protein
MIESAHDPDLSPIVEYLNSTGSADRLRSALANLVKEQGVKVRLSDVTGDGVSEAVVSIARRDYYQAHVLIFGCRNARWIALMGKTYGHQGVDIGLERDGLQDIRDLNGNGVADVIYSWSPNVGVHGYGVREYSIIEWDGQQFAPLLTPVDAWPNIKKPVIGVSNLSTFIIRPYGNGTYELAFDVPANKYSYYGGSEAERNTEVVYAWNGTFFSVYCNRYAQPAKYIADSVMDGDNETGCRKYEKAMLAYQRAIFGSGLLPWSDRQTMSRGECCVGGFVETPTPMIQSERAILSAYARYRIILLHIVQKQFTEARTDYAVLQKLAAPGSPGAMFGKLAEAFWEGYSASGSLGAGCSRAVDYTRSHEEILAFFRAYAFWTEGISTPAFALSKDISQICPFR